MTAQAGDTYPIPDAAALRRSLRTQLRRSRSALSTGRRRLAALRAAHQALRWRDLRRARHVAVYLAAGAELQTGALIKRLWRAGCAVYVPMVDRQRRMRFVPLRRGTPLRRDALGLRAPAIRRPQRSPRRLQAVVAPLVGFSASGQRLGAGGGYYDRCFGFRIGRPGVPRLYGYGYAIQQRDALPADTWDVPMDVLLGDFRPRRRQH